MLHQKNHHVDQFVKTLTAGSSNIYLFKLWNKLLAHYLFNEPALNLLDAGKYVDLYSPHLAEPGVDEQGLNSQNTHILGIISRDKHNGFYPQFSHASVLYESQHTSSCASILPTHTSFICHMS